MSEMKSKEKEEHGHCTHTGDMCPYSFLVTNCDKCEFNRKNLQEPKLDNQDYETRCEIRLILMDLIAGNISSGRAISKIQEIYASKKLEWRKEWEEENGK